MRASLPGILALAAAASALGCGGGRPGALSDQPRPALVQASLERMILAALRADGRLESADSLYSPAATIIADGRIVLSIPRFAAVETGGEVAATVAELQVRAGIAWAMVDYTWSRIGVPLTRQGRATFVFTPAAGGRGWWIVHLHSSTETARR